MDRGPPTETVYDLDAMMVMKMMMKYQVKGTGRVSFGAAAENLLGRSVR